MSACPELGIRRC